MTGFELGVGVWYDLCCYSISVLHLAISNVANDLPDRLLVGSWLGIELALSYPSHDVAERLRARKILVDEVVHLQIPLVQPCVG